MQLRGLIAFESHGCNTTCQKTQVNGKPTSKRMIVITL